MTAIDFNCVSRPDVGWPRFLGALLLAQLSPGFLLGLQYPPMLPFMLLGALIVGAPFAFLAFLPAILVLGKHYRMTWWNTAAAGFFSVLVALVPLFMTFDITPGAYDFLFFPACGFFAALVFWRIVGDFGGPPESLR